MPIIGNVERKSFKVKLLSLSIHLVLLIGSLTMIYPLLIMISGSLKSDVDFSKFTMMPEYIYDNTLLFQKYLLTKYNSKNVYITNAFREAPGAISNIEVPEFLKELRDKDYRDFLVELQERTPHYWRGIGMAYETGVDTMTLRKFRDWLVNRFGNKPEDIQKFNETYKTNYESFKHIGLPAEEFSVRGMSTDYTRGILALILEFKNTLPGLEIFWQDLDGNFVANLRARCSNNLDDLNRMLGSNYNAWEEIFLTTTYPADNPKYAKVWASFIRENVNMVFVKVSREAQGDWVNFLKKKYHSISDLNKVYKLDFKTFESVILPLSEPPSGHLKTDWTDFVSSTMPPKYLSVNTLANEYQTWLRKKYVSLDKLNRVYDMGVKTFEDILPLSPDLPQNNVKKANDMSDFIDTLSSSDIGLRRTALQDYRKFVAGKYTERKGHVNFQKMSSDYNRKVNNVLEIPFYLRFPKVPETGIAQNHYQEFIKNPKNASFRVIEHPEKLHSTWVKFLKTKYSSIDELNKAWGQVYTAWDKIVPPIKEYEFFNVLENRSLLIKEYLKRNYLMVIDTIITNGNAAKNTLIYCILAVFAALMINPLCAYALSRYKMAPSYKILLFLMLPMAFPPMVLGIPQFLLIKDLGLLNTFAALILPTMANGYSIFLLKGFFDSLPKELFESAAIDGASEWTVFWHIAMGLSTPILSVIALSTFTAAYGNFMLAFLLCQNESMWTMMVYLYQLQQRASQAVGFAALIVAAIPTLLVFIFCQNIIIKGIVVPTEK